MLSRLLLVLMAIMVVPFGSYAADVGDVIPHQLNLKDQSGQDQTFDTLKGENGLVVVFVRSADWCPYCKVQLIDLQAGGELITSLGYNIVTVSYDDTTTLEKFADKYKMDIPMLSDDGSEAIRAFGILNENTKPGSRAYGIPHPTIYVVDTEGHIEHILSEEGFKKRPSVEMVAAAIKG